MKTARRHELKENDLAHYLEQAVEWTSANAKLIVLGIVGVCAVVGAWFYFQQRNKQNADAAWDQVYGAISASDTEKLKQFVDKNKNTAVGQLANLHLADTAFDEGVGQMSVDREAAEKRLNDAKNRYYDVEQAAEDSRIEQRAMLGMGRYWETIGDLDKAKEYYGKLAKIENGLFRYEAERKLTELALPSSEEFSKWYTGLRPKPQPSGNLPLIQSRPDEMPEYPGAATATNTATATGTAASGTATASASPTGTGAAGTGPAGTAAPAKPSGTPSATPAATTPSAVPSSGGPSSGGPSTSGGPTPSVTGSAK